MGIVEFIIILAVLGFVWYLITTYIPMPGPIKTVITVLAVVALCVMLLQMIGVHTGINLHL